MGDRIHRRRGFLRGWVALLVIALGSSGLGGSIGLRQADAAVASVATTIAVVGDIGKVNQAEADVAQLVASWSPHSVLALGDDIYSAAATSYPGTARYDYSVGRYYCAFLKDASSGQFCPTGGTATENRFWSALGNHDYDDGGPNNLPGNYLAYFSFPSNERYFSVRIGPVDVFVIDSQGALLSASDMSAQRAWLQSAVLASSAPWQVVIFHHPAYSSGSSHGSSTAMRWPFATWGVDLVMSGHDHNYERVVPGDGVTYIVNGIGGAGPSTFSTPIPGSTVRYNGDFGAMKLLATDSQLVGKFISLNGTERDTFTLTAPAPPPQTIVWGGETWTVKTSETAVGPGPNIFAADNAWTDGSGYLHLRIDRNEASAWTSAEVIGPASLGYGTYTFTLGTPVDALDRNAVLGLFTWSDQAVYANREIDIEFATWGNAANTTNAQYVVQPFDLTNHLLRFQQPGDTVSTHSFTWTTGEISWESRDSTGGLIASHRYTGGDRPVPGDERVRLNLWLYGGAAPAAAQEVVIRSFVHTPPPVPPPPPVLGAFAKTAPANASSIRSAGTTYATALTWEASSQATGYRVCVDQKNNAKCDTTWEQTTGTSLVKALARGKTYYWQVQAVGPVGSAAVWANASATSWWKVSIVR